MKGTPHSFNDYRDISRGHLQVRMFFNQLNL